MIHKREKFILRQMDKVGACSLIRIFTVRLIRSVLLAVAGADLL